MSDDGEHELTDDDRRILKHVADRAREEMPSRRDALKLGATGFAAAGLGSAATGAAMADASQSDSDGDIGTPTNRVDVFSDGVDANSVNTDDIAFPTPSGLEEIEIIGGRNLRKSNILQVGTSATNIYEDTISTAANMVLVTGMDTGGDIQTKWIDLILMTYPGTVNVVGSSSSSNAVARSYSRDGYAIDLAMASSTYQVVVQGVSQRAYD